MSGGGGLLNLIATVIKMSYYLEILQNVFQSKI